MYRYVVRRIGLLAAIMSALSPLSASASEPPSVRISELQWAGSGRSIADEWIELSNTGSEDVDLSGWVIAGAATNGGAIAINDGTTLLAGDVLLIANYGPSEKSTLSIEPDLVTPSVAIPNTSFSIHLLMPDGTVVDGVSDEGAPDFGSTVASMERDLVDDSWHTATTSFNLFDQQLGTPGKISVIDNVATISPVLMPCQPYEAPTNLPTVESELPPVVEEQTVDAQTEVESATAEPITGAEELPPISEEPVVYEPVPAEDTAEPVEVPAIPDRGNVALSELVSDPHDGIEWIEIRNLDTRSLDLTAWSVRDASGKKTSLNAIVAPGAYHVVLSPLGKLNNDGDTVELLDAVNNVVDRVSYDKTTAPQEGASLAKNGDAWSLSATPTPGTDNTFPVLAETTATNQPAASYADQPEHTPDIDPAPEVDGAREAVSDYDTSSAPEKVTIVATATPVKNSAKSSVARKATKAATAVRSVTTLAEANVGERVRLTGRVLALPGTFGNQTTVIEGGVLYFHDAAWPAMGLGDTVTVEGEVSTARGEKRLKIAQVDAIAVTDGDPVEPVELTASLLASSTPHLVRVNGTVLSRDGDHLLVDMQGTTVTVKADDGTGITWSSLTSTNVTIVGVLRITEDGAMVMPRSRNDLQQEEREVISAASLNSASSTFPWVGAGLLTSSVGALGYWFARSRNLIPSFA